MMRLAGLALLLTMLAGCAGASRPVARTDDRYCESLGLTVGTDSYAECRLRQVSGNP